MIRKATAQDIPGIAAVYARTHDVEEQGGTTTGWRRDIYPTAATAEAALLQDDLYVYEEEGVILATAILNQLQVDVYASCPWQYPAEDS